MEVIKYRGKDVKLEDYKDNQYVSARTASKLTPTARTGKANKSGHARPETILDYIKTKKLRAKKVEMNGQKVWAIKIQDLKIFISKYLNTSE